MGDRASHLSRIPSVDDVLKTATATDAIDRFGRPSVVAAIRHSTEGARKAAGDGAAMWSATSSIGIISAC